MRLQGITDNMARKLSQMQDQEENTSDLYDAGTESNLIYEEVKRFLEEKFNALREQNPQLASQIVDDFIETYLKEGWLARDLEMRY